MTSVGGHTHGFLIQRRYSVSAAVLADNTEAEAVMTSARTAFRRRLPILLAALLFLSFTSGLLAYQRRGFGQYEDDDEAEMPIGARQKVEWTFVRFHYDMAYGGFRGFQRWAADYPKSDERRVGKE